MNVPQPHGYTPAPQWPQQPGFAGGQPNPGHRAPPRAPRSPITAVTGIALLLAALSTAVRFFWAGGTYSFLTVIPALQIVSGLGAAVACFAARGGAARPAAGVAGGLLLVTNLSYLLLRLEHSRYYDLGATGNWLTIPAALGALIAIVTVLIPTPDGRAATPSTGYASPAAPAYPNAAAAQPHTAAAPAPAPGAPPSWQHPAANPGQPANPAYPHHPSAPAYPAPTPGYSPGAADPASGPTPYGHTPQ